MRLVPGAAAPPDAGAEASPDFVAAAVREGGGMWRRSGDAESGQASRILPPDLILLALISNFSSIFGREREQKHRIHFWVFLILAIIIVWKNVITIHIIGNLPLQFCIPHTHALIYAYGVPRPTVRPRISV